ncbi:MAG: ATP-binding protein [Acidobacteria bacterium]|nr:ATP-binding protein [Acidobacteriota bacterium]
MSLHTATESLPRVQSLRPKAPLTLDQTGLPADLLLQLLLKTLHLGDATGLELGRRLCVPFSAIEQIVTHARTERLIEVKNGAAALQTGAAGYKYGLTDSGRARAQQFLDSSQYVGAAPIPLAQYTPAVSAQKVERATIDRERLSAGLSHLIISARMLDQLGPAVNAGKGLFLYGPAGNGKTAMAKAIGKTLGGTILVPHAIEVDGQIVVVYDPVNHTPCELWEPEADRLIREESFDRRWVEVERPVVMVGGELTLDLLDLRFDPLSRFYEAPLQMKANGGVLLVDDFGRQRVPARDLLNRWIVPLESRVDFLTFHTGKKFEVPFDVFTIFATNLDPEALADEAFLRRIPYKIYASDPTPEEYERIFQLDCARRSLPFKPAIVEYLMREYYEPRALKRRACHPRDLIEQVMALARFQGREPSLARDLVDAACQSYFLMDAGDGRNAPEPWILVSPGGTRSAPSRESERLISEIVSRAAGHTGSKHKDA